MRAGGTVADRRARQLQNGVDVTGVSAMDRTKDEGETKPNPDRDIICK